MVSNPLRVSQLIDSPARLTWQESVALVRGIATVRPATSTVVPSGTFEEFAVQENGEVTAVGSAPPLSVSELALLLARLLPPTPRPGETDGGGDRSERAPAGLHFVIARALALVDAPSFASVHEFSSALARFERARSTVLLRRAFLRHRAVEAITVERGDTAAAPFEEGARMDHADDGGAVGHRIPDNQHCSGVAVPDRRRPRMPSDVLRRLLREEDRRNFVERQRSGGSVRQHTRQRRTGPDPQMLRRFIREADERAWVLMREKSPGGQAPRPFRSPRRAGYHAAFVLLVLILAATAFGVAGRQRSLSVSETAAVRTVAPQAVAPPVAAIPPVTVAAASSGGPNGLMPAATRGGGAQVAAAHSPGAPRALRSRALRSRTGSASAKVRASAGPAKVKPAAFAGDKTPVTTKRRGPVPRLFAAIYHRLGSLVKHDPPGTQ